MKDLQRDGEYLHIWLNLLMLRILKTFAAFLQLFAYPKSGLEKTRVFLKKIQPTSFFLGGRGFWAFFYIYLPRRESFKGFFSFKNTFRCIQTFNYNHS